MIAPLVAQVLSEHRARQPRAVIASEGLQQVSLSQQRGSPSSCAKAAHHGASLWSPAHAVCISSASGTRPSNELE